MDRAMWASGERDFQILCSGLENVSPQVMLDIGCGVGRLLRPALLKFRSVNRAGCFPRRRLKRRAPFSRRKNA